MKRTLIWVAVIAAIIFSVIGLCFGKVIEETLFGEIGKWVVMALFVIAILEVFAFILVGSFYNPKNED